MIHMSIDNLDGGRHPKPATPVRLPVKADEQPAGCKSPYCEPPWCKNCGHTQEGYAK